MALTSAENTKRYRQRYPEKIKAYKKKYRQTEKYKEYMKEYSKKYYQKNKKEKWGTKITREEYLKKLSERMRYDNPMSNPEIVKKVKGKLNGNWGKKNSPSKETREKISKANSGEKSHLWKGNKMAEYPELERIRKSKEYKLWRKSVFERDNFTCQKTGISGGKLNAHHINNFADFPELRLAIDNGITLSEKAHKEFHKIYSKENNTLEQVEKFLNN